MTFSTSMSEHSMHASRARTTFVGLAIAAASFAGALGIVGPDAAHAAPASNIVATARSFSARTAVADPIATQASVALFVVRGYEQSGDQTMLVAYHQQLNDVAAAVAGRLEMDPAAMAQAWTDADRSHQKALLGAISQLGVPYRRNTSKEGVGFDCSGLTTYAWAQAGITLTRQSTSQIRAAAPRTFDTAQAGDIIQYPGHVMLWLGVDHAIVHAPYTGRPVEVDTVSASHRSLKIGDPTG